MKLFLATTKDQLSFNNKTCDCFISQNYHKVIVLNDITPSVSTEQQQQQQNEIAKDVKA